MRYVAFLRGINVGGRVIKMVDLKACFEKLGLADVSTVLQSGNVLFSSDHSIPELKTIIELGLTETFSYPAKVQVISAETLHQIVVDSPFQPEADHHSYVLFLENGLEKDLAADAEAVGEQVQARNGVLYWRVSKGATLKTPMAKLLAKSKFKDLHTNRNVQTLVKILSQIK